ncbi:MAG: cyclic nucleotide-binding domain-containing protein [Gammaproteobacteria bacterium]|nr:cyclic nucleotide-binding domain-containing protein [Gammaproteobacteria bacterium]
MAIKNPHITANAYNGNSTQIQPSMGSRLYEDDSGTILLGQPPEVLKGLLQHGISNFDTLVLPDVKEKSGSLMNSLEFPLYFFLFVSKGLEQGRRLNLVGEPVDISHALRLLRITLFGPTRDELVGWQTDPAVADEWLAASKELALKDKYGEIIPVQDFFNILPFKDGWVKVGEQTIVHVDTDVFDINSSGGMVRIDLNEDTSIQPPYKVEPDYVPGGLVKMGIEVLGGASGFTPTEPCTGLAFCYNGEYLLIDAIPFLDQHLFARGISKNQVAAVFLTHLHDDHSSLFPLMLMPHRVDLITTREIFNMAMDKISCGIGWTLGAVCEHFNLVEVTLGERLNYFGLTIEPHVTVHSIPTIGATFSTVNKGIEKKICVIGDNHSMSAIGEMTERGLVRESTIKNLKRLYSDRFALLVADGGAGAIHGDPADAIHSASDRVVFVHVEELANEFNTTFSLATSGKRYTILDGDPAIYTSQINHYLTEWLGRPFPNRWMRSLLAEEEIRRYNADDVILVQDATTRGYVYLILTGYCDVVRHDGVRLTKDAELQAGDVLGEMAVITGSGTRNASVIAKTPVTLCVFSEETFKSFIVGEGFQDKLLQQWSLRPAIARQPQFANMTSTVLEKLCQVAESLTLHEGDSYELSEYTWCLLAEGEASLNGKSMYRTEDYGARPFTEPDSGLIVSKKGCTLILFDARQLDRLRMRAPQLNYCLRKIRSKELNNQAPWILGSVDINN